MDPRARGRRILILIYVAAIAFSCLVLGVLMIGGTIWYMDCERTSGIVNCVITTRQLGTFVTETHTVSGVTRAVEVKDCKEDSCSYHVELVTIHGKQVYFWDEYLNESKAKEIAQINAYLMDSDRQAFHTRVVYRRLFIFFAAYILIGGAGLLFALLFGIKLHRAINTQQPAVLGKKRDGISPLNRMYLGTVIGPPPEGLQMERDISWICFHYRHPALKGWILLLIGAVLIGLGWGREPVQFWIFTPVGLILFYLGLVTLVNQWTIRVAEGELLVYYAPLPFYHRRRRVPASGIIQLYIEKRIVYARTGEIEYYVLEAVLQDHRRVTLLSELPYDVVHYIEMQIESWLNLEDRWVTGEASPQAPEKTPDGHEQG